VDVASHHATIDPILPELRTALAYLNPVGPKIPVINTAEYPSNTTIFGADYWVANLRNPVRFSRAVQEAATDHGSTFIEISPHPLLTRAIGETATKARVSGTVNRDHPETLTFHTNLALVRPPVSTEPAGQRDLLVDLPPSAWLHSRYWMQTASAGREFTGAHPLLGMHVELPTGAAHVWQADVGTDALPWLIDPQVNNVPAMPGAAFCEMALTAARTALGDAVEVRDVRFERMLLLDSETPLSAAAVLREPGTMDFLVETDLDGERERRASAVLQTLAEADIDRPADYDIDALLAGSPQHAA
jgi:acyl transferase domain-containing protein